MCWNIVDRPPFLSTTRETPVGLLAIIREWFGQAAAETGVAQPYSPPRLSVDLLAEPTAELPRPTPSPTVDAVDIHRTDIPPDGSYRTPKVPLVPDLPEPPEQVG